MPYPPDLELALADGATGAGLDAGLDARLDAFLAHGGDMVTVVDRDGTIRYASPGVARVLGHRPQELVGRRAAELAHPDDAAALDVAIASRSDAAVGAAATVTYRARDGHGEWRTLEAAVWALHPAPEAGHVVMSARDVTERELTAAQLRRAERLAIVGRLAGGVAHDFNNLLTVIAGCSDFICHATPPEDERRQDAEDIRHAADCAAQLTRQLLAFCRGRQDVCPEAIELDAVVGATARLLRRLVDDDVKLDLRVAPDAGTVRMDAAELQQVLLNLAVNARDAMPNGGLLLIEVGPATLTAADCERRPSVAPGEYARLRVRDTGCGMDERTLARAFEPCFTTKEPGQGTGLGLATVYAIVKRCGGHIWAESAPGAGSTFDVFLPRAAARTSGSGAACPPPEGGRSCDASRRTEVAKSPSRHAGARAGGSDRA